MTEENKGSILDEFYYTDASGNEHQIFPMKLKESNRVSRLFSKIDDTYLYLNLPTPKLHKKTQEIIIDRKTKEPVMDTSSYDSMMELFELALQKPKDEIEEIVDLANGVKILDDFRQVSGLKKKLQEKMNLEILQNLSLQ
jgi:hypothetical protein